jgi:hypothetical protein
LGNRQVSELKVSVAGQTNADLLKNPLPVAGRGFFNPALCFLDGKNSAESRLFIFYHRPVRICIDYQIYIKLGKEIPYVEIK